MYNVIHELVLETHRREKQLVQTLHPNTKLPICPSCSLPRLLDPPLAISNPSKGTQYCAHVPWSTRAGHDIYGNPFPVSGSDKPPTKKERERLKAESNTTPNGFGSISGGGGTKNGRSKDGTPASQDKESPGKDEPNIAGGPVDKKAAKVGERLKGGTYVPWHTCPSCKRSLLITRFAQHLEKCLGIGGRGGPRNAAARSSLASAANNNTSNGTPAASSRSGTPVPGSHKKHGADNDNDGDDLNNDDDKASVVDDRGSNSVRKKVLKRGLKQGSSGLGSKSGGIKMSNGVKGSSKRPPPRSDGGGNDGVKRERDDEDDEDDDDDTPLRKKTKLQRVGSIASLQTDADESVDGSFVNDDGDASGDDE